MSHLLNTLLLPTRPFIQRRTSNWLRIRRINLRSRGLNLGLRIVLASDIHARDDWFARSDVAHIVDAINEIKDVDLVVLLGDFVGDDVTAMDWSSPEYQRISPPTTAVLGNHDHWCDSDYVQHSLETASVEVLTNRSIAMHELVKNARSDLWIAGIDSCWTRNSVRKKGADPASAFANIPADAEVVVLGHEPHIATMHAHVLHLAGHTHCGQVRTPILGDWTANIHMPRYSHPFPCRLYQVDVNDSQLTDLPLNHRTNGDTRWVYTTAGVGYSTVSVRAFCRPELVVLDC